jgi:periplasmic protein TonB
MFKKNSASAAVASTPYGRIELKSVLHQNLYRGLIISVVIHLAIVSSYYVVKYIGEDEDNIPTVTVKMLKYSDLGPPPSITSANMPPPVAVAGAVAKPSVGMPVPVPDAEVSPEQTIATQTELSSTPSPAAEQLGGDQNVQVTQDIKIDSDAEPGMDEFVPVEKPPQIVKRVVPVYPEMAMRAGMEGTVYVKILVDKDGKPKKAVVIKSTTEIFNDAATEAAMQFLFTPAVMNNGPVKVWVAVPFKFKLKEATPS